MNAMTTLRLLLAPAALAALVTLSAPALAAPSPKEKAEAKALVADGKKALKEKHFAEAVTALSRAAQLDPSPAVDLDLAEALIGAGKLLEANKLLGTLAEGTDPSPAAKKTREAASKAQAALAPRIPTVTVTVAGAPAGASVTVDGAAAELGKPVSLDPGDHTVTATAPGLEPATRQVQLAEGARETVELAPAAAAPAAATEKPSAPFGGSKTFLPALIVTGTGGLGVVLGAVMGGVAFSATASAKKACTSSGICPDTPEQHDKVDQAKRIGNASTGLLVAGGLVGAAGVVLLVLKPFDDKKSDSPRTGQVSPWVGPRGEVGLGWTF